MFRRRIREVIAHTLLDMRRNIDAWWPQIEAGAEAARGMLPGLAEAVVANLGVQDALIPSRSKIVYRGAKRVAGAAVAALTGVLVATGVVKWRSRAIG